MTTKTAGTYYATRDFKDEGTGCFFEGGKPMEGVDKDTFTNYAAAGLASTEKAAADKVSTEKATG